MVQASLERIGDQKSTRRAGHLALHPAGQMVHRGQEDGGVRRRGHHGRRSVDAESRVYATHQRQVDDLYRGQR